MVYLVFLQMCGQDLMKYSVRIAACQGAEHVQALILCTLKSRNVIIKEGKHINQFELYAILIATREWAPQFSNMNVLIYCDNQTSVQVLHTGRVDCTFMQKCLREIRFHSASLILELEQFTCQGNRIEFLIV